MNDILRRQPLRPLAVAAGAALLVAVLAVPLSPPFPVVGSDDRATMPLAPELPESVLFERNEGQAGAGVAYVARADGHRAEIYDDGSIGFGNDLRLSAVGGRTVGTSATKPEHTVNYLHGNDASKWHTDIQTFGEVRFGGIYAGTDLVYHGRRGELEYDFVLRPGAAVAGITLRFEGATSIEVARDGALLVHKDGGTLRQKAPIAFQAGKTLDVRYRLLGGTRFGFTVAGHDPTKTLTIDPVLELSTLLGGDQNDEANAIAVSPDGSMYVTGVTNSSDFPMKSEMDEAQSDFEAFVTKLAPDGKSLIWSTYLGGAARDKADDIAIDATGRAFVTGDTASDDFPMGGEPRQPNRAGELDIFLAVLQADGQSLDYATYLGGTGVDFTPTIARDATGVYLAGRTQSTDFPTEDAYQQNFGGSTDAFLAKIDPTVAGANGLLYSTYLGGAETDVVDAGGSIAVRNGLAYLGGSSFVPEGQESSFPTTEDASDSQHGGFEDGFVAVFDPDLDGAPSLLHSTLVGGNDIDRVNGIDVDDDGNIYAVGETRSTDIKTTKDAHRKAPPELTDGFLLKLSDTDYKRSFLTLLGGEQDDFLRDIAVDRAGNPFVFGSSYSADFPVTIDRLNHEANGSQLTVTRFKKAADELAWSTVFGEPQTKGRQAIEREGGMFLRDGRVFLAGYAYEGIPTTRGAFQRQPGDIDLEQADGLVLKLGPSKFHDRKISLRLKSHLTGKVEITVPDGSNVCRKNVPVRIQHRFSARGTWKTVATARTDFSGKVQRKVKDRGGRYRAVATVVNKQNSLHICEAAHSRERPHSHG